MTPAHAAERSELEPLMRSPDVVMALPRLGSMHSTRLSFARTLVRRMARERWRFERVRFDMDDGGYGTAVYRIDTGRGVLAFVAFSEPLAASERTDRVIATRWDATFVLRVGVPDESAIERLRRNVPRQEAGRLCARELVLSRANKSVRLFEHACERLAQGRQPELAQLERVGYLMRTTAVYGNGKFGLADLADLQADGIFTLPYQAEMLTVYMARELSIDLVDHVAARRGGSCAIALDARCRRALGIGNATGLGMAPFLMRHPQLIHRWMAAREHALASVKALAEASAGDRERFRRLLARAREHVAQWSTDDEHQRARIVALGDELAELATAARPELDRALEASQPWARVSEWVERRCGLEAQELVNSLLIELFPERVDGFENETGVEERLRVDPRMSVRALKALLEREYAWALEVDFGVPSANAWFWYMSQDKAEPRLGERGVDEGEDREMRIDVARQVQALDRALSVPEHRERSIAAFLLAEPGLRGIVARVQSLAGLRYAEIRGNVIGRECLPIDLLRAKLAVFGAGRFDPKSDRWTRITLFQGAPPIDALDAPDADGWWMPVMPRGDG